MSLVRELKAHGVHVATCISPDGQHVATASFNSSAKLWNLASGALVKTLISHAKEVRSLSFSQEGKLLITASDDKSAKLWGVSNGKVLLSLDGIHAGGVCCAVLSPFFATQYFDSDTSSARRAMSTAERDASLVLTSSVDGTAKVWTSRAPARHSVMGTGAADRWDIKCTLSGHTASVGCCAISPDGQLALTASSDRTARVWTLHTGTLLHVLRGHTSEVLSCAFSPSGLIALTAGADRTVRLYDSESWRETRSVQAHSCVNAVAFTADGRFFGAAEQDATELWDTATGVLAGVLPASNSAVYAISFSAGPGMAGGGPAGANAMVAISKYTTTELWDVSGVISGSASAGTGWPAGGAAFSRTPSSASQAACSSSGAALSCSSSSAGQAAAFADSSGGAAPPAATAGIAAVQAASMQSEELESLRAEPNALRRAQHPTGIEATAAACQYKASAAEASIAAAAGTARTEAEAERARMMAALSAARQAAALLLLKAHNRHLAACALGAWRAQHAHAKAARTAAADGAAREASLDAALSSARQASAQAEAAAQQAQLKCAELAKRVQELEALLAGGKPRNTQLEARLTQTEVEQDSESAREAAVPAALAATRDAPGRAHVTVREHATQTLSNVLDENEARIPSTRKCSRSARPGRLPAAQPAVLPAATDKLFEATYSGGAAAAASADNKEGAADGEVGGAEVAGALRLAAAGDGGAGTISPVRKRSTADASGGGDWGNCCSTASPSCPSPIIPSFATASPSSAAEVCAGRLMTERCEAQGAGRFAEAHAKFAEAAQLSGSPEAGYKAVCMLLRLGGRANLEQACEQLAALAADDAAPKAVRAKAKARLRKAEAALALCAEEEEAEEVATVEERGNSEKGRKGNDEESESG